MDKTSLGDRMKNYENISRKYLIKRIPVIIRVDGRTFSSYTHGCTKPFDQHIMNAMSNSAINVANGMQGFKAAYIQSDEASFLITDYDSIHSQGWFGYNHSKIISISASLMTAYFNKSMELSNTYGWSTSRVALFDSRAFNIPREEVVNYFLFRSQDWHRNSVQMYARSVFSHNELKNKNQIDMLSMLSDKGYDWKEDLTDREKNGTFILRTLYGMKIVHNIRPNYAKIAEVLDPLIYVDKKEGEQK